MSVLEQLRAPVVLAPLAGGPSTPALAAALASAGGFGFVAGGYLSSAELGERIGRTRSLTEGETGVNLFVPGTGPAEAAGYEPFVETLTEWARWRQLPLGEPRYSDDDWDAKIELLLRERLPVVSFTFGCPESQIVDALHDVGSEVWVTVTGPVEAGEAASSSSLPLVASGGVATGEVLAATLCAGGRAAQIGSAFMLCREAGTSEFHHYDQVP